MRARFYSRTARTQGTFCFAFYKKRAARKPFRTACAEWEGLDDPAQNDGINADEGRPPPGDFCCPDTTGRAKLVVKQPVRR